MDELYGYQADIPDFLNRNADPKYRGNLMRLVKGIAKRCNVSVDVAMAYFDKALQRCGECGRFFPPTDEYFAPGRWSHICHECNESQSKTMTRSERQKAFRREFSKKQREFAIQYFNGCCATCGRQLYDLFGERKLHFDHWIPLTDPKCPGTVATNMVPLCGGIGGCNNSKHAADPHTWLRRRFGPRKAREIEARIETYFSIVRERAA